MEKKKVYDYKDDLTMKIEITLVGKGIDIEKYRRAILAITTNLDSVSVTYPKIVPKED